MGLDTIWGAPRAACSPARRRLPLLLGIALLALGACGDVPTATPPSAPSAAPHDAGSANVSFDKDTPLDDTDKPPGTGTPLNGTKWALASLEGEGLLKGTTISLDFAGERLTGSAGCNNYGGRYTATGGGHLTTTDVASTAKLCWAPEGILEQERRYLDILRNVTNFRLDGGRLWLDTADGRTLIFIARD